MLSASPHCIHVIRAVADNRPEFMSARRRDSDHVTTRKVSEPLCHRWCLPDGSGPQQGGIRQLHEFSDTEEVCVATRARQASADAKAFPEEITARGEEP